MAHGGLNITRRDIEQVERFGRAALSKAESAKEKGEAIVGHVSQTLETSSASLGFGVLMGRFGPIGLGPVPVDLAAGLALHLLGFAGVAGKYDGHLHNFGDGVLAGYTHRLGVGFGAAWRVKSGLPPMPIAAGENARMHGGMPAAYAGAMNPGRRAPLTEAELAAMANAYR